MQKQQGLQTTRHCKGMRDLRQQQLIRHTSGGGSVFQKLDRIAREREILLARARLWATNFRREEERIAELDREREALIRGLETLVSPPFEQRRGDYKAVSGGSDEASH